MPDPNLSLEWLETDGLGGYAMGTASLARTRRYHGLLVCAEQAPVGRRLLVAGFDAWLVTPRGSFALSSQAYAGGVLSPDGHTRISGFRPQPWPQWSFRAEDGTELELELFQRWGLPITALRWSLKHPAPGCELRLRPFLAGRDHHALMQASGAYRMQPLVQGQKLVWETPGVECLANARYTHDPHWYNDFHYAEEAARGYPSVEPAASPGVLTWSLTQAPAVWILGRQGSLPSASAEPLFESLSHSERIRRALSRTPLELAADAYIVQRGWGRSIIAGYPWFTDFGRDTFIALRGLCLARGRVGDAVEILFEWLEHLSRGMLPNTFPESGGRADYQSADASLWYAVAVHETLRRAREEEFPLSKPEQDALFGGVESVLDAYAQGARFGIRLDEDGLLAVGEPGTALTWMDAKLEGRPVTPRIGKPVEIQALWLNALEILAARQPRWRPTLEKGRASFPRRFWNEARQCLYDRVDVDHRPGTADPLLRPNQIFAVGGLPFGLLPSEEAWCVVETVENTLLTRMGLRTLAPGEPGYRSKYQGGEAERDEAYHQGTAWPWLLGPFVEAWVRVRRGTESAKAEARRRFVEPLLRQFEATGHLPELADAAAPRGCPFQAWSVGELLRLELDVLRPADA